MYADEKRKNRREAQFSELVEAIEAAGCDTDVIDRTGGQPRSDQLIGHRDGSTDNIKLVKLQKTNFKVREGHANVRAFISTRGQPFGLFKALRDTPFYISDVYQSREHIETDNGELLDATAQINLKFEDEE